YDRRAKLGRIYHLDSRAEAQRELPRLLGGVEADADADALPFGRLLLEPPPPVADPPHDGRIGEERRIVARQLFPKFRGGALPIRREVEPLDLRSLLQNRWIRDARDAVRARLAFGPRDQIPRAALGNEAERVDNPLARAAELTAVREANPAIVPE